MKYTIEIATTNYASTAAAVQGGADRIELCSALSEGGLTASHGYLLKCRKDFNLPIFPIIRPRGGDFLYTPEEFDVIKEDVLFCKQAQLDGIVTGFLKQDGTIDKERICRIAELAYPMKITFHRAFDRCKDPLQGLEDIIQAGCHRILTSGQQLKALDGIELIKQLVEAAAGRIIIMPGSGVRKENIAQLAKGSGATEFHSSLAAVAESNMQFIHPSFAREPGDYITNTIQVEEVHALIAALKR